MGSYLAHGPEIYPKAHKNPRAFSCISGPIYLKFSIQCPCGVGLHHITYESLRDRIYLYSFQMMGYPWHQASKACCLYSMLADGKCVGIWCDTLFSLINEWSISCVSSISPRSLIYTGEWSDPYHNYILSHEILFHVGNYLIKSYLMLSNIIWFKYYLII